MNPLVFIVALAALVGAQSKKDIREVRPCEGAKNAMLIIEGVLEGMGFTVTASDLTNCVNDSSEIGALVQQAIKSFSKHSYDGAKDGIVDLSKVIIKIQTLIADCSPARTEIIDSFKIISSTLSNPVTLVYNAGIDAIVNGKQIYTNIQQAIEDYHSEKWRDLGFNLGQLSRLIASPPKTGILDTLLNLYNRFFGKPSDL